MSKSLIPILIELKKIQGRTEMDLEASKCNASKGPFSGQSHQSTSCVPLSALGNHISWSACKTSVIIIPPRAYTRHSSKLFALTAYPPREQRKPLFINFVDVTKASDTASQKSLYKVLEKIACPPFLLQQIFFFHKDMNVCIQLDGKTESFKMSSGIIQGCVLAPTLFAIYLRPSCNMPLMGFKSKPDLMDLFSIWKDWSQNNWWLKENCSSLMMLQ